jgi:hypothetical protein
MALTRRAALKGIAATAVGTLTGAGAYGIGFERHRIASPKQRCPLRGLDPVLDGIRIGLITDVHHSAMGPC